MKKIKVDLEKNSYPICIQANLLSHVPKCLDEMNVGKSIVLITDTNVDKLYANELLKSLTENGFTSRQFAMPAGEQYKSQTTVSAIYDWLLENHFKRDVTIIALGGGVVGDLAGFIAATYMRGVRFIQIPTTLLAQVDSSVGGKVGINHHRGKNVIGAFYQPGMVIIDPIVLKTLPQRELYCGLAEIVKYALILDDKLMSELQQNFNKFLILDDWEWVERIIFTCCRLKSEVVQTDEKENGLRRILNFGHTIGHALESATDYVYFTHGEAIAWGMLAAAGMSLQQNYLNPTEYQQIKSLIHKIEKPAIPDSITNKIILEFISHDKKATERGFHFVLLEKIGKACVDVVDEKLILIGIERMIR